jgi:transcriptional regulator with XRE-family HTH domain
MSRVEERNSTDTQVFLDRAYELVTQSLRDLRHLTQASNSEMSRLRELAERLGIPISVSSTRALETEQIVGRITLLPIAQECVIMILRAIFEKNASGTTEFRKEHQKNITRN